MLRAEFDFKSLFDPMKVFKFTIGSCSGSLDSSSMGGDVVIKIVDFCFIFLLFGRGKSGDKELLSIIFIEDIENCLPSSTFFSISDSSSEFWQLYWKFEALRIQISQFFKELYLNLFGLRKNLLRFWKFECRYFSNVILPILFKLK